ncbi:MAG: TolC family protein [bacterium JZ-2024 1]
MSRRALLVTGTILFLVAAASPGTVHGNNASSSSATVDSLIQSALMHNPELIALELRYQAMSFRVPPAGSLPDPTIGIYLMNMGAGVTLGDREMSQFGFSVSQAFPYSGKRAIRRSVAQQEADLLQFEIQRKKLEIIARIRSVYTQLYALQESIRLLEDQKANLKDILMAVEALYVTGRTPQAEVLRAQVAISRLESAILEKRRQQEALLPELARLVGSAEVLDLPSLNEPDFSIPGTTYEDLWVFVRDRSPDLARNTAEQELARRRLQEAQLDYKPDAMLMFSRSERGKEFGPAWEVRAEFSVPFWRKSRQDYRWKEAQVLLSLREQERDQIIVSLRQFVRSVFSRLQRTEDILEHINSGLIPQAELTYRSALTAYPAGKIDLASLLDALTTLFELRLQRLSFLESIWLDRVSILSYGVTRTSMPSSPVTSAPTSGRMTGMGG